MKVSIELSPEYKIPHAIIYTDTVTDEIRRWMDLISSRDAPITAQSGDQLVILRPEEIYMVRVEGGDTVIYGKDRKYYSRRRLYEVSGQLGSGFMQISKAAVINLACMDSIEAGFNGTLLLKLRNGCREYVSRKFLPEFKKYLGI